MSSATNGRRGRLAASAAAAVLFAAGAVTLGVGALDHPDPTAAPAAPYSASAPAPAAASAPPTMPAAAPPVPPAAVPAPPAPAVSGPVLPASVPVSLDIPQIGVHTPLLRLGLAPDGTADVPPGEPGSPAGWYEYSPTPGEVGPAVILGHVNSTLTDIGVFYRLHELAPGEQFTVTRADGTVAVFQADRSAEFKKDGFPTLDVYGNTDRAEIRLITCGGYDPASRTYTENTIVYAHLVSSHPV